MTFKAGRRLGIGAFALLLVAVTAQSAAARHGRQARGETARAPPAAPSAPGHRPRPAAQRLAGGRGDRRTGDLYRDRSRTAAAEARRAPGFLNRIPGQTTFVSSTASQGSCSGNPLVYCNLGALAPRTSATVTIVVTADQHRLDHRHRLGLEQPARALAARKSRRRAGFATRAPTSTLRLTGSPGS